MGFIDFGIVGRVTPVTWTALEALLTATATRDFETMARALATVGATDTDVDVKVRTEHSISHTCAGHAVAACLKSGSGSLLHWQLLVYQLTEND